MVKINVTYWQPSTNYRRTLPTVFPDSKLTLAQRWHMVGRLATHRSWYKDIGPTSDQHCNYHSWIIDIVPTSGRRCYFNVGELTLVKYWTDVVEPMLVCNHCTNIGSISDTALILTQIRLLDDWYWPIVGPTSWNSTCLRQISIRGTSTDFAIFNSPHQIKR